MVTALHPSMTGIPKYTEGIAKEFERSHSPVKLFLLVNKDAKLPLWSTDEVKVMRCWQQKITYPFQIMSHVLRIRPSVVHIQHEFFLFGGVIEAAVFPLLMLIIRLSGFPVIVTLHGVPAFEKADEDLETGFFMGRMISHSRILLKPFIDLICRLASLVIVHSEFTRSALIGYYGILARKVIVVPHGVDESLSKGEDEDKSSHDVVRMLFFGFITPTKGIEDLVAALSLISDPKLELDIAGGKHRRDNHYFDDIVKLCADDARITVAGYVPDELVSEYFVKADFIVLPHRYQLSSSGALALALAYERPVIVTSTPHFSEVIKDGYNGLVVRAGDVNRLMIAIDKLAQDRALRQQLHEGCKETKTALGWSALLPKLLSVYREVSDNKRGNVK